MNDQPTLTPPEMPNEQPEKWETAVLESARHFAYPPTPDIAGAVRSRLGKPGRSGMGRTLRWAAVALLALAIVTLAVPETRAFVLEFLRVGVVRVFFGEPTGTITTTARPSPTRAAVDPLRELTGETTLDDARKQFVLPVLLPTYPPDLGAPDHVFAQEIGPGIVVTLLWMKPDDPQKTDLLLQMMNPEMVSMKYFPWQEGRTLRTQVNGQLAYWLTGVHRQFLYGDSDPVERVIDKNLLLWDADPITYRLESELSLDDARMIAESLAESG